MSDYFGKEVPKLGFGLMRLPKKGLHTDIEQVKHMVDLFMEAGFTYTSSRVDMLVEMNIVKKDNEQHRNRIFAAQKYIDIFMDSR